MPLSYKIGIFVIATIGPLWLSWSSLRDLRSHGFYRFFIWEIPLILVLLNLEPWFDDPFCLRQIISWVLFIISISVLISGITTLRKAGKADPARNDPHLIGIEKTTALVTTGPYRFIRHPIYSSVLFAIWGIFLKKPSIIGFCLAVLTCIFMTLTAKTEEVENIGYFGEAYRDYMKRTKMFVPYTF